MLSAGAARDPELVALREEFAQRAEMLGHFRQAYRRYCWSVTSVDDLRLAPFHLLASEGAVHTDKDHRWHMETLARLCQSDAPFP